MIISIYEEKGYKETAPLLMKGKKNRSKVGIEPGEARLQEPSRLTSHLTAEDWTPPS